MGLSHQLENRQTYAWQLIHKTAGNLLKHPGFGKSEREDPEQELVLALLQQQDRFDPQRASETTFIKRVKGSTSRPP